VLSLVLFLAIPALAAASPPSATGLHTVQAGETLWSLARQYATTPERLAALNQIALESKLAIGRTLKVPASAAVADPAPASRVPARARAGRAVTAVYQVQAGDTLWKIAKHYDTRPEVVAALNGLSAAAILQIGQSLKVPAPQAARSVGAVASEAATGGAAASVAGDAAVWAPARRRLAALPSRGAQWASGLVSLAMRQLGVRYRWGGTSPAAFDCSGFMYYVYGRMGVSLPRTTFDMFDSGTPVPREELQVGDIVFFETVSPGPSHAGIYLGDGRFIHSSSGFGRVTVTTMDHRYYASRYLGARRF
jgi:cell wall-associated NlpC family hydrolase